jgi:DnaJ-class molecular chaperone
MTMDKPKPKKKTEVYRAGQVEEYEIGAGLVEEFECPLCGGSGEEEFELEGVVEFDVCRDCDGSGVLYAHID